jgi:adenine-specific DNA-methyltransferase
MPTLTWTGKDKVINHHHDVPLRVLQPEYTYAAPEGSPANSADNRIIHGDNLEALKSLLPEFEGRVNCIYIDPPYNTGNEGWVYNDAVNDPRIKKWLGQVVGKEGEDLTRHDKWLCMMYPRLKLLHRLLAKDGVIFISIDDVEAKYLNLILDEIFSQSNFITKFIWKSRQNKDNRTKNGVSVDHEYVFCYGKKLRGDMRDLSQYSNQDNDSRGVWTSGNMVGLASKEARPNLHYDLINPETMINYGCPRQGWRYDRKRMESLRIENRILWPSKSDGRPREKVFLSEMKNEHTGISSILNFDIYTYHGTREIEEVFEKRVFDFPKASDLILKLLEQAASDKDAIVLDSFAGSGTTAHAVLKLNAQDGGNRRFILCEMMDYAETITAERVRRVMSGYGEGNKTNAGLGGSFTYHTIGAPLFLPDNNLNEAVGVQIIRDYVAYTENIPHEARTTQENPVSPYLLGQTPEAAWLFYYEPERITSLDIPFLESLQLGGKRPSLVVVYADTCLLAPEFLQRYGLIFKKIPRDITRL